MIKYCVHLILEGLEEEKFFEIVKNIATHETINLTATNADGAYKIGGMYQDAISKEEYDIVLCIYDVDYKADDIESAFNYVRTQLIEITGSEEIAEKVSFCNNPNILIWYLVGTTWNDKLEPVHHLKPMNTKLLHKYWPEIGKGIDNNKSYKKYEAREYQVNILRDSYLYDSYSYNNLLINGSKFSTNIKSNAISTNMYNLLKAIKDGDINFFENIKNAIEKE